MPLHVIYTYFWRRFRAGEQTGARDMQSTKESRMDERYEQGLKVRREVLGDAHVERALARVTDLDADFQRFITETAWGSLWTRPDLDRRTRSLVTIAILAA